MTDFPYWKITWYCQAPECICEGAFTHWCADFWADKSLDEPLWCRGCKDWMDSREDYQFQCRSCDRPVYITAGMQRMHHKKVGAWVESDECRQCQNGNRPPQGAKARLSSDYPYVIDKPGFELPVMRPNMSIPLNTDPDAYQHAVGHGQTRQEHIQNHTTWAANSLVNTSGGVQKSPTSLANQSILAGASELERFTALLQSANIIARSGTDAINTNVVLYVDKRTDNYVKVTSLASGDVEVTIISSEPDANGLHELITTYDNFTIAEVDAKLSSSDPFNGWM